MGVGVVVRSCGCGEVGFGEVSVCAGRWVWVWRGGFGSR